jgi:hypothetical protein
MKTVMGSCAEQSPSAAPIWWPLVFRTPEPSFLRAAAGFDHGRTSHTHHQARQMPENGYGRQRHSRALRTRTVDRQRSVLRPLGCYLPSICTTLVSIYEASDDHRGRAASSLVCKTAAGVTRTHLLRHTPESGVGPRHRCGEKVHELLGITLAAAGDSSDSSASPGGWAQRISSAPHWRRSTGFLQMNWYISGVSRTALRASF